MKTAAKARKKPRVNDKHGVADRSRRVSKTPTLNEVFKDFIGCIKDGPPDLARNHKLYASLRHANSAGIVEQTSFLLLEELGIRAALTDDEHFRAAGFDTLMWHEE